MNRKIAALVVLLCLGSYRPGSTKNATDGKAARNPPTFSKDVAPIFYKNCVACHMPDGMAPMSLLTYKDARPWAKAIREKVIEREMPPWHADDRYGEFANDRRLSKEQIDTIVAWVDGGALKGDDKDLPAAEVFEGWRIGKPDVVLSMPQEFTLQAEGPDEYRHFIIPTTFKEDRWVQAAEARPGNRRVVHHIIAFIRPPRSKDAQKTIEAKQNERTGKRESILYQDGTLIRVKPAAPVFDNGCATPEGGQGIFMDGTGRDMMPSLLCGQAPGRDADIWPAGLAKKVPAGSEILLQVHYAKNGAVEKDQSRIGLVFAKEPPGREILTQPVQNHYFLIPPGAEDHVATACYTFKEDVHITALMPHMHLRGKVMQIKAVYPTGESKILLSVPKYDFSWQTTYYYKNPVPLPRGTRVEVQGHFDNSAKNIFNPDRTKAVRWGDPTYDEMMIAWVDYTRDSQKITGSASMPSPIGDRR